MLKKTAKEITDNSKLLRSVQSHRTGQAAQHPDFNHFSKSTEQPVKQKCKGCGNIKCYAI